MIPSDALTTIAEVAVALIGFSGLAAALLGRSAGKWDPRETVSLWSIIGFGAAALLFALLPFPLHFFDLSPNVIWASLSAALGALGLAWAVAAFQAPARMARRNLPLRFPRFVKVAATVSVLVSLLLFLNVADLAIARGPAAYILALIFALIMALLYFGLFIILATGRGTN